MEENIINTVTEQVDVVENTVDAVQDINLDVTKGDIVCLAIAGVTAAVGLGYLAWTKLIKPAIDKHRIAKQCEQENTETVDEENNPESDSE